MAERNCWNKLLKEIAERKKERKKDDQQGRDNMPKIKFVTAACMDISYVQKN